MTKSKTQTSNITAVIIAKNEAATIVNCLNTLSWCDEILVIDSGSSDDTAKIAEKAGARVLSFSYKSMAKMRNSALKRVKTKWVFYIDADERVTPNLAKEIMVHLETAQASALTLSRQNIHYGQIMTRGGWESDLVTRVFSVESFQEWFGDIHESPKFKGESILLKSPLVHLTHRNTLDGLHKTISWTPIEAELLAKSDIQPVKVATILRKGIMEFLRRGFFKAGFKDGQEGMVEAIVQGINRMLIYIQVWEKQQSQPLEKKYQNFEEKIAQMWQS